MADLAGTEKRKRSGKSTQDTPTTPRCANDKQKRAPEEGEGKEFLCCAISTRKMPGKTRKKTYNPSMDFIENFETLMKDSEKP